VSGSKENDPLQELRGKRVIVTGASGFIGHNLVRALSKLEAEVVVIDRTQPNEHFPHVEFEWADLRHLTKMYETDYLIHLAAVTNAGYAERYPIDTYEQNVLGTINLLNHVQVSTRIMFPSTALVYGASSTPIQEDAEQYPSSIYAQSKVIGEQLIKFHCQRVGVDYTLFRFFNVFGRGQLPMYIVPQVLRQIVEEGKVVIRNGTVMRDLLYVEDCIDAVMKLAVSSDAAGRVFNIGSGHIVSIAEVAKTAALATGQPDVEIIDLEEQIDYSPTAIIADITRVQSTIDWFPKVDLREGLRRMWQSDLKGALGSDSDAR
jgi:UDP-glucose 4-epimerase